MELQHSKSWTDDLPVCLETGEFWGNWSREWNWTFSWLYCRPGVGLSTNQIYKQDGHRREAHESEDRSFHFKIDDNTYLYGVFNGTDGSSVADFAAQRMPAEILLGQLKENSSPVEVKQVLRDAFFAVERSYFESIDDLLAERANLHCELPEGKSAI